MSVSIRRLYNQDCVYQFFVLSKFPFGVSNRGCLLKGLILLKETSSGAFTGVQTYNWQIMSKILYPLYQAPPTHLFVSMWHPELEIPVTW